MLKTEIRKVLFLIALLTGLTGIPCMAFADYVTVDGKPVTQGQMRITQAGLDQIQTLHPQSTDRFILEKTLAEVEITGVVARVRLRQIFKNPYDERLETSYVFPMPENSAVDAYSFRIGEKVIKGVVKERQKARKEYEKARNEGRKAGLLEQERPNIFTQSLVNIPPKARVVANIEYVHTLKIDGANYLFSFPMVVAPRYIPGLPANRGNVGRGWANDTDQVPDASRITPQYIPPGMRAGHDIEIQVKIDAGMPIQNITGVTHSLDVSDMSTTGAAVQLKNGSVIPNKDFVLEYKVGGDKTMLAVMTHRDAEDCGYFSAVIQPKHRVQREEISPREMIMLLDISGSMGGTPISQLRIFSEYVLGTLNPQDRFNIIAFDDKLLLFASGSREATPDNIRDGQDFVRNLNSRGGTEMLPAIQKAIQPKSNETNRLHRYLIIVTDALVGNDKRILKYLKKPENSHLRIYPIAMGSAPNEHLIERAAEIGRGFSMRITNQDNARKIAERFTSKISYPIMTDLSIDWGILKVKNILPCPLPDLYADRPLIIMGKYEIPGTSKVTLSGNVQGKKVETRFDLTLPENDNKHDSLPVLWARARIKQLVNKDLGDVSSSSKDEITRIGLKYQILTDYTSFIAVEREMPQNVSTKLRHQSVLLAIPEGMEHLFDPKKDASSSLVYKQNKKNTHTVNVTEQQSHAKKNPSPGTSSNRSSSRTSGGFGGGGSVGVTSIFLASALVVIRVLGIYRIRRKDT